MYIGAKQKVAENVTYNQGYDLDKLKQDQAFIAQTKGNFMQGLKQKQFFTA